MNPASVTRIVNPRDVWTTVLVEIAKNLAMAIPVVRKIRARVGRTIVTIPQKKHLERYTFDLLRAVESAGGVSGKSVLEIGPGDNLVTGLAFLAAGAKSYTAIDRFPGAYASPTAREWYRLLSANWPDEWPADLDPDVFPDDQRVATKAVSVEGAEDIGKFDIVCSYHVGEHVSDIAAFAELTKRSLYPGGVGVHVVDFGGHQWNRFGDPFLFLKFPTLVWDLMGSARGECNRVRFREYADCFRSTGLRVDVPMRKECRIDAADEWVRQRADESFVTTDAIFVLRAGNN